jgi:hypothetical protein
VNVRDFIAQAVPATHLPPTMEITVGWRSAVESPRRTGGTVALDQSDAGAVFRISIPDSQGRGAI